MNPLQRHALHQAMLARQPRPADPLGNITTRRLIELVKESTGIPTMTPPLAQEPHPAYARPDVAICVGGGGDPLAEYEQAAQLCAMAGKSFENIVCNDALAVFPGIVHQGVTLHPDKWLYWKNLRERAELPMPLRLWAHRSYPGFTDHTKDWQGSSGLFMIKIARELGHTHIIGCGIPMTVEAGHFARQEQWNAAPGFRRGWARVQGALRPFVRSMSGWTKEHFGIPTVEWLQSTIEDRFPMRPDKSGYRA